MAFVQYKCCTFQISLLEKLLSILLANLDERGGGDINSYRRPRGWGEDVVL